MHLSPTELNTLSVLCYVLNPEENFPEITAEWVEIEKELETQTVGGLLADRISEFGLSEEEKLGYTLKYGKNLRYFHQVMQEQSKLESALERIPYVILKGAAAAMYYPKPEMRQMGDIDVLVKPEDYEKAKSLLCSARYKIKRDNGRHTGFRAESGIVIELHQKFSSSDDLKQNDLLDQMLYAGIENREIVDVCGYKVPVLPKLENGLVLLGHINQHLSSGLGLRQIVDWMMYVRECMDDAFWNECFREAADSIGMRRLAETVTLLCRKHLGLEGISWCDGAEEELADGLLEYIFSKGNFGRKDYPSNATVSIMRTFRNPIKFFRFLTTAGSVKWKAAEKHKWLKPFAWIYELVYLIKKGLQRKIRPSQFLEEAKQSKKETELLEKLGVTRK